MTAGQSCSCVFGIKEASKQRRLLDMLREIAINRKRQFGPPVGPLDSSQDTNETFCGADGEVMRPGMGMGTPPGMGQQPGMGPPPGGRPPYGRRPPPGMGGPG